VKSQGAKRPEHPRKFFVSGFPLYYTPYLKSTFVQNLYKTVRYSDMNLTEIPAKRQSIRKFKDIDVPSEDNKSPRKKTFEEIYIFLG